MGILQAARVNQKIYICYENIDPGEIAWPWTPAQIRNFGRLFYVFNDVLYHELLICYIQSNYNILKLRCVWVSALVLDQTFINNWCVYLLKMLEN